MNRILQGFVVCVAAPLYLFNLTLWFLLLAGVGLLRLLIPLRFWRQICRNVMEHLPVYWVEGNYLIQQITTSIEWDVRGIDQLRYQEWYLLIANHQSWADILVLQRVLNKKIPPLKFFLKRELLWTLPLASWACWLLGFPFMRRYSKATLAKRPWLKGKDIKATEQACTRFREQPSTVANFVEGTRFTEKKRDQQQSPYLYLLRPRAAGIAFSLSVLGDFFHKILNVTIIYPSGQASLWDFLCGNIKKISVLVEAIPITPEWLGNYQCDRQFRISFQKKLNGLWKNKDQIICETHTKEGPLSI